MHEKGLSFVEKVILRPKKLLLQFKSYLVLMGIWMACHFSFLVMGPFAYHQNYKLLLFYKLSIWFNFLFVLKHLGILLQIWPSTLVALASLQVRNETKNFSYFFHTTPQISWSDLQCQGCKWKLRFITKCR